MKTFLKIFMAICLVGCLSMLPASAAEAANKAARTKVSFNKDSDYYVIRSVFKKTDKMKKNMKISADIYIPRTALKKNGDMVSITPNLQATKFKKGGGNEFKGHVDGRYSISLEYLGKKVRLRKYDHVKNKETAAGKYATFKKVGKYYVVKLKNIPLYNEMTDIQGNSVKLNTKEENSMMVDMSVTGSCSKTNGYIYVDNITLKAKKTQKITFNKKDYRLVGGYKYNYNNATDSDIKVKVTNIK